MIFTKNACWFCFWFFNKILHLKKWISRTTVFKRKNNIAYEFREWLHRLHGPLFRNVDVSFVCVCVCTLAVVSAVCLKTMRAELLFVVVVKKQNNTLLFLLKYHSIGYGTIQLERSFKKRL